MDVVVVIAEFKNHLKSKGYAASTIEGYRNYLDLFKTYLLDLDLTDLRKASRQVILDYQEKVMSEPIAMESKALKIRPVKRLFEYLTESHKLLINPTEGIVETCRTSRKLAYVLTVDEVKRLLAAPNLSMRIQIRDRAIMEVLYSTGIRLDELLNLEVYHADLKDKVLYIRKAKGKRQRVAPLGKNAVKYLKEYLEKIRPRYAKKNPRERRIFLNNSGLALKRQSVQAFVRKYRLEAGIKRPVSPHALRRSCATHMVQNGADIRYVQKLLGHKHLKTTQIYTRIRPVDVKRMHEKTHPNTRGQKAEDRGRKKT
ncbi:MAG: tyrosine-type recombinase/integrase [Thermodesulfobacteriota bacterium]|nr:tyrosine-type recombinase/integrase [Thermodesulfobacteriota bacterium]